MTAQACITSLTFMFPRVQLVCATSSEGVFNLEHPGREAARGRNALRPILGMGVGIRFRVGSSGVSKNKPVLPCAPKLFGIFQLKMKENEKNPVFVALFILLMFFFWPKSAW